MNYTINERLGGLRVDRVSITFAVLLVVVTALGIGLQDLLTSTGTVESATAGMSAGEQAATGTAWALFEVAVAASLLGLVFAWRRLPEVLQSTLKTVGKVGVMVGVGAYFAVSGMFLTLTGVLLGTIAVFKLSDELDVYWLVNDVIVIGVGAYLAAYAGVLLSPWVLAAALVGLSIYDHVFANKQTWMFELMKPLVTFRLPVLFLVPTAWRFDWDTLAEEAEDGETAADVGFGIGMADLALPAAFVVSVVAAGSAAVTVVVATILTGLLLACARMSWKLSETGSGAGLPPLTTGALGGWAVGSAFVMVVMV